MGGHCRSHASESFMGAACGIRERSTTVPESDTEMDLFRGPNLKGAARYYPETPVVQALHISVGSPVDTILGGVAKKRKHGKVEQDKAEEIKEFPKDGKACQATEETGEET